MVYGTLYIIATPIGNHADWSSRAVETISNLDFLAAEDTRKTGLLLARYNLSVKTIAVHDHNESDKANYLISLLKEGKNIGLVSDAGTPLISDPGFRVVRLAQDECITVSPIPGACAAISALSVSGIPTDRFCFEGFLPSKEQERVSRLKELESESRTLIFYEAPSRVLKSICNMADVFGISRRISFAREITKTYETVKSGTIAEIINFIKSDKDQELGEIVIVVEGLKVKKGEVELSDADKKLVNILVKKYTIKDAVEVVRQVSSSRKKDIYNYALTVK